MNLQTNLGIVNLLEQHFGGMSRSGVVKIEARCRFQALQLARFVQEPAKTIFDQTSLASAFISIPIHPSSEARRLWNKEYALFHQRDFI
jgi:hypothetical protein